MIAIGLNQGAFLAQLEELARQSRDPQGMRQAAVEAGARHLRAHFEKKDSSRRNRLGGRRQHFWNRVAQSVEAAAQDKTLFLRVVHPAFAHKLRGGVIRARKSRNLAIPLSRGAYGRSPADLRSESGVNLFFVKFRSGKAALASRLQGAQGLQTHYLLQPEARQRPESEPCRRWTKFKPPCSSRPAVTWTAKLKTTNELSHAARCRPRRSLARAQSARV